MAKFVLFSDPHLDVVSSGIERFDDSRRVIEAAVQHAIEWKADAVLFPGDLCNPGTSRSYRAIAKLIEMSERLKGANIEFYAIPGNHDVVMDGSGTSTLSPLAETTSAFVFDQPTTCVIAGIRTVFLPYCAPSHHYSPDEYIRGLDKPTSVRLVVGHLGIDGAHPGSEETDMPRGRSMMFPRVACGELLPDATLINGHIHQHNAWTVSGQPDVISVGSTIRFNHGEEHLNPGFLTIEWT